MSEKEEVGYLLKMPRELKKQLEEEAKSKGKTLKDYIVEILEKRNKVEHVDIERLLKARWVVKSIPFDTYCSSCGDFIPKNVDTVWVVGTKINFCLKCVRKLIASAPLDTDYWKKALDAYKKYVQYRKLAQAARKELDNLIDVISEAEARKRIMDLAKEVEEAARRVEEQVSSVASVAREYVFDERKLEELRRGLEELQKFKEETFDELHRKLEELASMLVSRVEVRRRRKEREEEAWS